MEVHLNPPFLSWNIRERKCRIDGYGNQIKTSECDDIDSNPV